MKRLLLFDLDGTLLRTDKTISERTFTAIENSKKKGYLIGISTSRSEKNCTTFLGRLEPEFHMRGLIFLSLILKIKGQWKRMISVMMN